jgi:hypothetical protein
MRRLLACFALLAAACGGATDEPDALEIGGRWCVMLCVTSPTCVVASEPCGADDRATVGCALSTLDWVAEPPALRGCAPDGGRL